MAPRKKLDNARHHLFSVAGLLNLAIGNAEEKQAYDELRTWFKEFVQACRADNDGGQREQAAVEKLNSIAEPFKGYKKNTRPSLELIKQWFKDHKGVNGGAAYYREHFGTSADHHSSSAMPAPRAHHTSRSQQGTAKQGTAKHALHPKIGALLADIQPGRQGENDEVQRELRQYLPAAYAKTNKDHQNGIRTVLRELVKQSNSKSPYLGTPKQVFEELGVEYPPPAAAPAAPVYDDSTSDPQGYQEYDYGTAANPYYVDDTPGPSSYRAYRDARTPGPPLRRSHSPLHEAPPAPTHQGYMSVEDAQALSGWGHPGGSSSYAGPSNNYNQDQHHYQSLARRAASAHGTVARTRAGWSPRVFAWQ